MTADERDAVGGDAGGAFEILDPRLTIYALANGMDLNKEPATRRLEWYYDGMDRGIAVEAGDGGTVVVTAMAWTRETPGSLRTRAYRTDLTAEELAQSLSSVLEGATEAANEL
jgi:hypothetical protein